MPPLVPQLPEGDEFGVLGEFPTPKALYQACTQVRDAGYTRWDAHTPFPVHGLERAMGLRNSPLGWIVLVLALGGAVGAMVLQWWISTTAYPLVISGKPFFSWQAFVPVTFEVAVMGGAMGAIFGMFALNQLPMLHHPLFNSSRFLRASDDRFFISIESWDPKYDSKGCQELLARVGATHIEVIKRTPEDPA